MAALATPKTENPPCWNNSAGKQTCIECLGCQSLSQVQAVDGMKVGVSRRRGAFVQPGPAQGSGPFEVMLPTKAWRGVQTHAGSWVGRERRTFDSFTPRCLPEVRAWKPSRSVRLDSRGLAWQPARSPVAAGAAQGTPARRAAGRAGFRTSLPYNNNMLGCPPAVHRRLGLPLVSRNDDQHTRRTFSPPP